MSTINTLAGLGLALMAAAWTTCAVILFRRGFEGVLRSLLMIFVAAAANWPILEVANRSDPEAGPFGLFFLATISVIGVLAAAIAVAAHGIKPKTDNPTEIN